MNYTIERAKLGDEYTLANIQINSWKAAYKNILSEEILLKCTQLDKVVTMYKNILNDNLYNGYIMKVNGTAHCIAFWKELDDKCADILCIHSLPDKWRNGYGRIMMNKILEDIKLSRNNKVILWVFKDNISAIKFYESIGFKTNNIIKQNIIPIEILYEINL